jgi:hypothetical protein
MNAVQTNVVEQPVKVETTDAQAIAELNSVELAYIGGGMANVSFV